MNSVTMCLLDPTMMVSSPPPGSVNVKVGSAIEGPGGRWIPCATRVKDGIYLSGMFQVGPGQRQVCFSNDPRHCPEDALSQAVQHASLAAAA